MPLIVVVGNEKGGAGKTMTAVNLAASAAVAGQSVLLVDTDGHQNTALKWGTSRATANPDAPPIATVQMQGSTLARDLKTIGAAYDLVVVDTAPADSVELRACMTIADVFVVPVKPSNFELWALQNMGQLFMKVRRHNPKLRAVVVASRIQRDLRPAAAVADVEGFIGENAQGLRDSPIVTVYERVAYDRASGGGLGVAEWQGSRDRAAQEFALVWDAVKTPPQEELDI